ncbi:MAG: ribosome biogenesis GTPase Der [Patescibacteria group bacterium]
MPDLKTAVIIGRTNVGKSTLYNRLAETAKAMTSNIPGTTRDRNETFVQWRGGQFRLVDTGGLDIDPKNVIEQQILKQIRLATKTADLLIFVVDGQSGLLPQDREASRFIQALKQPTLVAVNKLDNVNHRESAASEFTRLGWPDIIPLSAKNGSGTGDLLDAMYQKLFPNSQAAEQAPKPDLRIAVIGRPNAGKSSLVNALVGEERSIVTPIPYTTRESHDTYVHYQNQLICIIDTAGLRKHSKIREAYRKTKTLEKLSESKTLETIRRCDVALLVIDLSEPLTHQDKHLIQWIITAKKGLIILANKSDLVKKDATTTDQTVEKVVADAVPFLDWAPIVAVSAKTRAGVHKIFPLAIDVATNRKRWLDSKELKEAFVALLRQKHPPLVTAKRNIHATLTITQSATTPPSFTVGANIPGNLPDFYLKYLEKKLRERFHLTGTPLVFHFKKFVGRS